MTTSWRVEVVEDETGTTIDSREPATLNQEWWRRDKRGHLTREEDAMLDEWGYPRGDPVERLNIRSGGDLRLVDDFEISRRVGPVARKAFVSDGPAGVVSVRRSGFRRVATMAEVRMVGLCRITVLVIRCLRRLAANGAPLLLVNAL